MQDSDIPAKLPIPFANNAGGGYIRPIPQASQIGITPGAASLHDGFVPLNFIDVNAGGIPPFGQDVNGILNIVSAWVRWMSAGGPVGYDATLQSAIGGYPKACIVQSATTFGVFWVSTVDNNVTNPDTGGAGWVTLSSLLSPQKWTQIATVTAIAGQNRANFTGIPQTYSDLLVINTNIPSPTAPYNLLFETSIDNGANWSFYLGGTEYAPHALFITAYTLPAAVVTAAGYGISSPVGTSAANTAAMPGPVNAISMFATPGSGAGQFNGGEIFNLYAR
jgi:hypothetical protein